MTAHLDASAVLREAISVAEQMISGEMGPHAGAARIWLLSSENDGSCFEELRGFIAAASGHAR